MRNSKRINLIICLLLTLCFYIGGMLAVSASASISVKAIPNTNKEQLCIYTCATMNDGSYVYGGFVKCNYYKSGKFDANSTLITKILWGVKDYKDYKSGGDLLVNGHLGYNTEECKTQCVDLSKWDSGLYQCYGYSTTKTGATIGNNITFNNINYANSNSSDTINDYRYVTVKGNNYNCGDKLYITTCTGSGTSRKCNYEKVNTASKTGTVIASNLRKPEDFKKSDYCSTNPPAATKYTITLNGNGTKKFACPTGFTTASTATVGVCNNQKMTSGQKFTLPTVNESGFNGWSTSKDCSANVVSGSQTVTGNKVYYACYGYNQTSNKEIINGYRLFMDGAVEGVACGTKYYITSCETNGICYYCTDGKCTSTKTVNRNKLAPTDSTTACKVSTSETTSTDLGDRYVAVNGDNFKCGDKLYITTCGTTSCNFSKVNGVETYGTVIKNNLKEGTTLGKSYADAACKAIEITNDDKKCPSMNIEDDNTSEWSYNLCYDESTSMAEIKDLLEEHYRCDVDNGYSFDRTYVVLQGEEDCNDYICKGTYAVRCKKEGNGVKPIVDISPAVVGSNNIGVISIKAKALEGEINAYYKSEYYTNPTLSDDGWVEINNPNFTIESTPGTVYVWVKDTEGNISNVVSATVLDNNNSNNTLQKIALYDANGKIQTPSTVSYSGTSINSNKYVMMSNDLRNDSKVLADAFNPYAMEYKVEVASPTLTVYATLTSSDAKYVDGYEPRTVNLNYGTNTILIKIQDKEGKVRTYTILATRTDDRTSDNTLSDLKVSVGKIEFNANVTDYKIEIPANTKTVDVSSVIASNVASYVSGYEPGSVSITGDTTVKLIKVKSQTGSTRTYVLTFVKEGTDEIKDKTLQLKDLVIPDVFVAFESDVANYSFSVPYEMDSIDIKPVVNDENSNYTLSRKRKNESDYKVGSNIGVPLDVGENFIEIKVENSEGKVSYYRFTVVRKEFGLGISSDTALKDLRVLNYDIKFEPNKKEYTVKIKQEKSLVITAVPASNRAEVFIRGNDELTGFSTVRVKVVAENGEYDTYSIDIKKDAFNKTIEIASIVVASVIILGTSAILIINKKRKSRKEYFSE